MTRTRYYAGVAVVYFAAVVVAVALAVGGVAPLFGSLLLLPVVAAAFGVFVTALAMARFGALGGSVYFFPTVLHVTVLLVLALAVAREAVAQRSVGWCV